MAYCRDIYEFRSIYEIWEKFNRIPVLMCLEVHGITSWQEHKDWITENGLWF
jgi:hypothetical protein